MKLVEAQEGRRVLDRLVGWETSPVLWRVFGRGQAASAGRVQSVAVRMVVQRERGAYAIPFRPVERSRSRAVARRIKRSAPGWSSSTAGASPKAATSIPPTGALAAPATARTTSCCSTPPRPTRWPVGLRDVVVHAWRRSSRLRSPSGRVAPFTTSTLQQESGRKLRLGAARTMSIAQRLYERGFITYMRTDSTNLSEQAITGRAHRRSASSTARSTCPAEPRAYRSKVKNAQEAHEAIRPAGDRIRRPDEVRAELDADEQRLYELIWIRTDRVPDERRARQQGHDPRRRARRPRTSTRRSAPRARRTTSSVGAACTSRMSTRARSRRAKRACPRSSKANASACTELLPVSHETKPPARYTEASLVKELEERGIGRPSTYAAVIETIQARDYVWRKGTALVPAWTAFGVTNLLEQHFGHLVDYSFTATMEEALDVVARGEGEAEKWLHTFYFGNGQPGLHDLVDDRAARDRSTRARSARSRSAPTTPVTSSWCASAGTGPTCSARKPRPRRCPPDIAPDELTDRARARAHRQAGGRVRSRSAPIPRPACRCYVLTGRFGPYVQLGEQEEGTKKKPKRVVAVRDADARDGHARRGVAAALAAADRGRRLGRTRDRRVARPLRPVPRSAPTATRRSLATEDQLLTVTMAEAEALFAQPKTRRGRQQKPPIAELGEHPDTQAPIRVLDGRYGPYVTDGT